MNNTTTVEIEEDDKQINVKFTDPISDRQLEHWFEKYLTKAEGVTYIAYNSDTHRLAGYGVLKPYWDNFRFWIGVALYESTLDEPIYEE